jgi:glycosyltransferase involved in cell wall biosynthesis
MQLIYLSPVTARSYAQRPHYMVRALLARGMEKVLWVNPYPTRLPRFADLFRRPGLHEQGTPWDSRLEILDVPTLPLEPLPGGSRLNRCLLWKKTWDRMTEFARQGKTVLGIGKPSSLALAAIREIDFAGSFYDAMDNFPEFQRGLSRRSVKRNEDALAREVDFITASSTFLSEKFARRGLRVKSIFNGYEMSSLPPIRPKQTDGNTKPILGFLGCLGPWLDWPLIARLAESKPEMTVEMIGPKHRLPPRNLPPNIKILPPCPQSEAASHLARFSAGLIPFRSTALTAGVDPIKYYEYRAAGLPTLSTSFGEMAERNERDGVYVLDPSRDLSAVVDKTLQHVFSEAETLRFREENDWDERFVHRNWFDEFGSLESLRKAG